MPKEEETGNHLDQVEVEISRKEGRVSLGSQEDFITDRQEGQQVQFDVGSQGGMVVMKSIILGL